MASKFKMPQFGTSMNYSNNSEAVQQTLAKQQQEDIERKRIECIQKGGEWDDINKTCSLDIKVTPPPVEQAQPEEATEAKLTAPEFIVGEDGKPKGLTMPDGRTLLGLSPEEARDLYKNYTQKRALPEGAELAGTAQRELDKKLQAQQILSQLGQVTGVSQQELQGLIDKYGLDKQLQEGFAGAFREGTTRAVTRGITYGGAALGATAVSGGAAAPTIPFAIAGGVISGYWSAIRGAKKAEFSEDVSNAMAEFTQLRRGISNTATMATSGYVNPSEAVELYNAQLSRMLEIEAQIKYLQDTNLKDYLSGGSTDLATVQTYINQVAPAYGMRIQTALINPTTKIPYSDIILQDMQDMADNS